MNIIPLFFSASFSFFCIYNLTHFVDISPELSDSGYYILLYHENEQVNNTLTHFGTLLKTLVGDSSVIFSRYLNYAIVFLSPMLTFYVIFRNSFFNEEPRIAISTALMLGVASSSYFKWLLLDPSYNSLTLSLSVLAIGFSISTFRFLELQKNTGMFNILSLSCVTGFIFLSLALTKISAAILILLFVSIIYIFNNIFQNNINFFFKLKNTSLLLLGTILGALLLIAAIWIRTASPLDLIEISLNGFEAARSMGISTLELETLRTNFGLLIDALDRHIKEASYPLIAIITTMMVANFVPDRHKFISHFLVVIAIVFLAYSLLEIRKDFGQMALRVWVITLFVAPLSVFSHERPASTLLMAFFVSIAPFAMVFGTASRWHTHVAMFVGAAVLSTAIIGASVPRMRFSATVLVFTLSASLFLSAFNEAETNPYRLGANTSAATIKVSVQGETFRATPSLAAAYEAGLRVRKLHEATESRPPLLIDMTGRAPTMHWIGGFSIPGNPWILSGLPGSDNLLDWTLQQLKPVALQDAWIMIDVPGKDGERFGLSTEMLNRYLKLAGVNFPEDFVMVDTMPITYMNLTAIIYAPRGKQPVLTEQESQSTR